MNLLLTRGPEREHLNPKGNTLYSGKAAKGFPGREYAGLISSSSVPAGPSMIAGGFKPRFPQQKQPPSR